jgi:predicted choloylglycine hydrolase
MARQLHAVDEPAPGTKWQSAYRHLAEGYRHWFLREGDAARPAYLPSVRMLKRHMPELMPVYERLVELAGGSDQVARLLTLWRPTPYLTGCSQAVWNRGSNVLVRNYDYLPRLWDGVLLGSAWSGHQVIAMTDTLWGALDGMNDAGLAVSLAFGGRKAVGDGFGIPLVLRYLLETCETAAQAAKTLERVPSHMSYNVTVVDRAGAHVTAHVAPDRPTAITRRRIATNHQHAVEWRAHAHATGSVDRERFLTARLNDLNENEGRFVRRFLEPPLHSARFDRGWGTLYTAVYRPALGAAEYRWPGATLHQSFERFRDATVHLTFGLNGASTIGRATA